MRPFDTVQWVRRDLRPLAAPNLLAPELLREVEMPADWTAAAAMALLEQSVRGGRISQDGGVAAAGVRSVLESLCAELGVRGLREGYFVSRDDAAIFADELAVLLLRQMAALGAAPSATAPLEKGPRVLRPNSPDLAGALAECAASDGAGPSCVVVLPQSFLRETRGANGSREHADEARERLHRIAATARSSGEPMLRFAEAFERWSATPERWSATPERPRESGGPPRGAVRPAACLNLPRFLTPLGSLNLAHLGHAVALLTTALDLLVTRQPERGGAAEQQRPAVWLNERPGDDTGAALYRSIALQMADLGALLMEGGLAYDTPESRAIGAALAALICGEALAHSAQMAETCAAPSSASHRGALEEPAGEETRSWGTGVAAGFSLDSPAALALLRRRREAAISLAVREEDSSTERTRARAAPRSSLWQQLPELRAAVRTAWDRALISAELVGLRNLEVTALPSDGALAAVLDCDTAGVEPVSSLVHGERKTAAGEPADWRTRRVVGATLFRLGYAHARTSALLATLERTGSLSAATGILPEHRALFAPPRDQAAAVLRMGAEMQPFVSAAAPLRLVLAEEASTAEVAACIQEAGRLGVAALRLAPSGRRLARAPRVAGPAGLQPIRVAGRSPEPAPRAEVALRGKDDTGQQRRGSAEPVIAPAARVRMESPVARDHAALLAVQISGPGEAGPEPPSATNDQRAGARQRLPSERASVTHAFAIDGQHGNITVGLYPDGTPGEIFVRLSRGGAATAALLEAFSTATSLALQHGVSLRALADQLTETQFEPFGSTANPAIPYARSVVDYLFQWLLMRFPTASPSPGASRRVTD